MLHEVYLSRVPTRQISPFLFAPLIRAETSVQVGTGCSVQPSVTLNQEVSEYQVDQRRASFMLKSVSMRIV